uniref:DMAS1 n=1 Tax=Arundo donax TaxID=35708 RepID=A0A0A8Y2W7_ARUDO
MPFSLQNSLSFFCCHTGFTSTWLTEGGIVAKESRVSSFLQVKLQTPMDLARPSLWHSSMASHTACMSKVSKSSGVKGAVNLPAFMVTGQWIMYRST